MIGSLKEQCLTKPPPNFRGRPRRSSSLVLDYIGKKVYVCTMVGLSIEDTLGPWIFRGNINAVKVSDCLDFRI